MNDVDVYIDLPKANGEIELLVRQEDGTYKHIISYLKLGGEPTTSLKEAREARRLYIADLEGEGKVVDGVRSITSKLKASVVPKGEAIRDSSELIAATRHFNSVICNGRVYQAHQIRANWSTLLRAARRGKVHIVGVK